MTNSPYVKTVNFNINVKLIFFNNGEKLKVFGDNNNNNKITNKQNILRSIQKKNYNVI